MTTSTATPYGGSGFGEIFRYHGWLSPGVPLLRRIGLPHCYRLRTRNRPETLYRLMLEASEMAARTIIAPHAGSAHADLAAPPSISKLGIATGRSIDSVACL